MPRFLPLAGLILLPTLLMAQPPVTRQANAPAENCDMRMKLLTIPVVDSATGKVLQGTEATIVVSLASTGAHVRDGEFLTFGEGVWVIAGDGELPTLKTRADTVVLRVEVRRPGRAPVRRNVTVGLDERGCHVAFRDDLKVLRI